jgi:hypothetical protein
MTPIKYTISDADLAARIRSDIKYLNDHLAEAAQRRINVHVVDKQRTVPNAFTVTFPQAAMQSQPNAYLNENSQLEVTYIQRTLTEKF